jgi:hypothetical protein
MADFASLYLTPSSTLAQYDALIATATTLAPLELASCIKISRLFRGQFIRTVIAVKRAACINIQRVFRGTVGRGKSLNLLNARNAREDVAVFHYHAMVVQRTFRGFYSRRYYHDYSARKAYILSVVAKGDELRKTLADNLVAQREREHEARVEQERDEFVKVTANLHHLLSTAAQPGIYNSPYNADQPPTAMGIPVEEHLRVGVKDLLRTRMSQKVKLVPDMNGTLKIPVPHRDKRTLQATSQYDAVEQNAKMENKLGKTMWASKRNFLGGGTFQEGPYQRGINEGTPFLDMYKNPFFTRGEPGAAEKMKAEGKKPFYTSVGGNKSSVQSNGIFDIIQEAEVEGGVTSKVKVRNTRRMQYEQSKTAPHLGLDSNESLIIPERDE